jgi:hypothetical protein
MGGPPARGRGRLVGESGARTGGCWLRERVSGTRLTGAWLASGGVRWLEAEERCLQSQLS